YIGRSGLSRSGAGHALDGRHAAPCPRAAPAPRKQGAGGRDRARAGPLRPSRLCRRRGAGRRAMSPRPIPEDALEERFVTASGPGGQNVNKVASAVQLRVDVFRLGLSPESYKRLKTLAGSRLAQDGTLIILAQRFRTQEANREDARARLVA